MYVKLWSKLFDITCILVILLHCLFCFLFYCSVKRLHVCPPKCPGCPRKWTSPEYFLMDTHVSCAVTNAQPIHPEEKTRVDCLCFRSFPFSQLPRLTGEMRALTCPEVLDIPHMRKQLYFWQNQAHPTEFGWHSATSHQTQNLSQQSRWQVDSETSRF